MNEYVSRLYKQNNDIFGIPQEYKGVKIYPISISEVRVLELFNKLLFFPKKYIPDKKIWKMSYLKFLLYVIQSKVDPTLQKENLGNDLLELLKKILRTDKVSYEWNSTSENLDLETIKIRIKVEDIFISEEEFDDMREMILEQNGNDIDFIEDYNPDLEEKLKIMNHSGEDLSFKDQVFAYATLSDHLVSEIENSTLYQMKSWLSAKDAVKNYDMYTIQLSLPEGSKIQHYLKHLSKSRRYETILVDKNQFEKSSGFFDTNDK